MSNVISGFLYIFILWITYKLMVDDWGTQTMGRALVALNAFTMWALFPETKGRTLEEMDDYFVSTNWLCPWQRLPGSTHGRASTSWLRGSTLLLKRRTGMLPWSTLKCDPCTMHQKL